MSAWFLRVLVILFCIGGFEVQSQPSFWNVFFKLCICSSVPLEIRTESWVHKLFCMKPTWLSLNCMVAFQGLQTCLVSLLYR
jgi:hypothetical protein